MPQIEVGDTVTVRCRVVSTCGKELACEVCGQQFVVSEDRVSEHWKRLKPGRIVLRAWPSEEKDTERVVESHVG